MQAANTHVWITLLLRAPRILLNASAAMTVTCSTRNLAQMCYPLAAFRDVEPRRDDEPLRDVELCRDERLLFSLVAVAFLADL
jgi:hypothetical protein